MTNRLATLGMSSISTDFYAGYGGDCPAVLEDPANDLNDPKVWAEVVGGEKTKSGVRVTPELVMGQPPFWRGMNILCSAVAAIPFDVYQNRDDGTKEKDRRHFASRFLRKRVNQYMTAFVLRRTMTYHKIFRGNGVAIIERDGAARPLSIVPCDPTRFGMVWLPIDGKMQMFYLIGAGKEARFLNPDNVLHVKGLSYDGLFGIDVYTLMREALGLGVAARRFGAMFFGKGANAGGFLQTPAGLTPEAEKRLEKDFKKAHTGLDNAFKVALLEEGAKFVATQVNPEQAQFLETRKFETREVANIIGIQSHLIGDKEGQAYNSLEAENQSYLDTSLDPHLQDWEDEYNLKLLTTAEYENDICKIEANRRAAKRIDTKTESDTLIAEVNNGVTLPDEARNQLNRPAYPKGIGQRFRMPTNIGYADQSAATAGTSSTQNSVRALFLDRVQRMQQVEVREVTAKAEKSPNFVDWVDGFYASQAQKMEASLRPAMDVAATLWDGLPTAKEISRKWCDESKAAVLKASECQPSQLTESVRSMVVGWNGRGDRLAAEILGEMT